MKELPERIACQQDEEDVYEHYAREANAYVLARLPYAEAKTHVRRFFVGEGHMRWVSKFQLEQMQEVTGRSWPNVIPMQSVLNDLKRALRVLSDVRRDLGLPAAEWIKGPWEDVVNGYERGLDEAIEGLKSEVQKRKDRRAK